MSQTVTVELPDGVYSAVKEMAEAIGTTPAKWIAINLPRWLPKGDAEPLHPNIPNEIFALLQQLALQQTTTVKELAGEWVARYGSKPVPQLSEVERQAAWAQLQQHIGAVSLGYPTGADNESIDADLAREYASTHEEERS